METIYGGGGVESGHAIAGRRLKSDLKGDGSPRGPRHPKAAMAQGNVERGDIERKLLSRSSDRPASTLSDGEEYAREACADGSPELIQDYADRRGV